MAKVEFTLTGCANGHPVRIAGKGAVTQSAMRVAFRAVEAPFTFDASLALFAGFDAVAALAAGLAVDAGDPVVARLRTDFLGEGGVDVGTIAAVATVERRSGGYRCAAQLAEARVALEVGERITAIGARTITAVAPPGGLVLLSASTVATSRGRELTVVGTAVLVGADAGDAATLVALRTSLARGRASISYRIERGPGASR